MNSETHFCLRVDVDTFQGLKKGISQTYKIVKDWEIPATIYLSLGKYATGRNLFRKIKHREKFSSISPIMRNSVIDLTRGVLLPPAKIGKSEILFLREYDKRDLIEIHPHGYNHVKWSSSFKQFSTEKKRKYIEGIFTEYGNIFNKKPIANAAPNFQISKDYFQIMKEKGIKFLADYVYSEPFNIQFYSTDEKPQKILQLPVTEPNLEDLIIQKKSIDKIKQEFRDKFEHYKDISSSYVCFYFHAIYEPFKLKDLLEHILNLTIKFDMKPITHKNYSQIIDEVPVMNYDELAERG